MNILYLNPNGLMGGAEVALIDMLASLRTAAPDWTLNLVVAGDGPLAAKAGALGVGTTILPFPPSLARLGDAAAGGTAGKQTGRLRLLSRLLFAGPCITSYTFRLRKTIRQLNPDVVHTNGFKMHVLGALARPGGVSLIWHIHDYVSSRPFMARLIRAFQGRCARVLANSNSVKADIENLCGETLKVRTVYNGVDTSVFSPEGPGIDLDQLSGLPPHPVSACGQPASLVRTTCGSGWAPRPHSADPLIRVGLLATLARWKGHEVFLRAFSLIPDDIPLRGYIIGDALYQTDGSQYSLAELKTLAQQLGVSDRVGFTGFIDQPAAAMRSLDIVVHASTQPEPFGLVIVEGMACGRPVIVSEAGGATELIEPGTNALAHTPGDARQLADRIQQLATDAELRTRLRAAGRLTVETRFDRARLASELIPIYQEIRVQSPKSKVQSPRSQAASDIRFLTADRDPPATDHPTWVARAGTPAAGGTDL